jgi:hypothetical protein
MPAAAPHKKSLKKSVRLIAAVRTTAACRAAAAAWRCVPTSASMSAAVVCVAVLLQLLHGFSVAHASDALFERCLRAAAAAAAGRVLPVCQAPEPAERL